MVRGLGMGWGSRAGGSIRPIKPFRGGGLGAANGGLGGAVGGLAGRYSRAHLLAPSVGGFLAPLRVCRVFVERRWVVGEGGRG